MKIKELRTILYDFWQEFKLNKLGLFALILLGIFIVLIIFEPLLIPFSEADTKWRDISYWEDNSRNVPPVWINAFSSKKYALSKTLSVSDSSPNSMNTLSCLQYSYTYSFTSDVPPLDLLISGAYTGSPIIQISVQRPDTKTVELIQIPLEKNTKKTFRISIDKDAKKKMVLFATSFDRSSNSVEKELTKSTSLLFSEAKQGMFSSPHSLKGDYIFTAQIISPSIQDSIRGLTFKVVGSASGVLGTDNSKRDIWSGIAAGVKWALLIGLLTAFLAVSIGVIYGVACAYFGSWKDSVLQRIFEVFLSIPLLPLLIVMSAIFQPSILILIIMMSCFFWVGPVKTVRSIGLQIKEEMYIEAARSFGASGSRIIFKHMIPLLIPYAFASMAMSVPQAIVYESSISLLGLGDSTIVTWGQILHDAFIGGAIINGQWWWIIPPGFFIACMGMTFAFIGFAMDKILLPKLRTR